MRVCVADSKSLAGLQSVLCCALVWAHHPCHSLFCRKQTTPHAWLLLGAGPGAWGKTGSVSESRVLYTRKIWHSFSFCCCFLTLQASDYLTMCMPYIHFSSKSFWTWASVDFRTKFQPRKLALMCCFPLKYTHCSHGSHIISYLCKIFNRIKAGWTTRVTCMRSRLTLCHMVIWSKKTSVFVCLT